MQLSNVPFQMPITVKISIAYITMNFDLASTFNFMAFKIIFSWKALKTFIATEIHILYTIQFMSV